MGYGRVGQHRKSGSRGGRGKAGMHKHKWSYTIKYAPDHFGKHGFKSIHPRPTEINVGDLERILEGMSYKTDEKGRPVVNLTEAGFDRLIGKGRLSSPIKVIVAYATERATRKIEAVGGEVVIAE